MDRIVCYRHLAANRLIAKTPFETIETEVKTELLDKLKELDPYFFEKVILILLKKSFPNQIGIN